MSESCFDPPDNQEDVSQTLAPFNMSFIHKLHLIKTTSTTTTELQGAVEKHKMENIKHIMKRTEEPTGSETAATEHENNKSGIKFTDGKHALQYRVHGNQMGF